MTDQPTQQNTFVSMRAPIVKQSKTRLALLCGLLLVLMLLMMGMYYSMHPQGPLERVEELETDYALILFGRDKYLDERQDLYHIHYFEVLASDHTSDKTTYLTNKSTPLGLYPMQLLAGRSQLRFLLDDRLIALDYRTMTAQEIAEFKHLGDEDSHFACYRYVGSDQTGDYFTRHHESAARLQWGESELYRLEAGQAELKPVGAFYQLSYDAGMMFVDDGSDASYQIHVWRHGQHHVIDMPTVQQKPDIRPYTWIDYVPDHGCLLSQSYYDNPYINDVQIPQMGIISKNTFTLTQIKARYAQWTFDGQVVFVNEWGDLCLYNSMSQTVSTIVRHPGVIEVNGLVVPVLNPARTMLAYMFRHNGKTKILVADLEQREFIVMAGESNMYDLAMLPSNLN